MPLTTTANSPLAQARRAGRIQTAPTAARLSQADQTQVRQLLEEKYEWIDHEDFHQEDEPAERLIYVDAEPVPVPDTSWYHPVMDTIRPSDRGTMKSDQSVVLTASQERTLFKQYNYARFRVCRLRDELQAADAIDPTVARTMLRWYRKADRYRQQIANTNLALVLAMAKRTRMNEVDFADLISEGNMALLRAVDKFDAARGFKFSTYACRAIIKAFSRQGIKLSKYRTMFPTDFDPKLERSNWDETRRDDHEQDCVSEVGRVFRDNIADLSEIERQVIHHRFGVAEDKTEQDPDAKPLTLEQVGKLIGVTKERVRQIQNKALIKLREEMEDDFLR